MLDVRVTGQESGNCYWLIITYELRTAVNLMIEGSAQYILYFIVFRSLGRR